jgi:hypothetical protein
MSKCPECGTYPWQARNFERQLRRAQSIQAELERQAAAHAVKEAQGRVQELDRVDDRRGLQGKVRKQAAVIRELEDKLRKLGRQPHAEIPVTMPTPEVVQGTTALAPSIPAF